MNSLASALTRATSPCHITLNIGIIECGGIELTRVLIDLSQHRTHAFQVFLGSCFDGPLLGAPLQIVG